MTITIAGVDEVGRGPIAGSVVAAAVIFKAGTEIPGLTDSKKLSAKKREYLFDIIIEHSISWAIGECSVAEIDEINILQASLLAMKRAIGKLSPIPNKVLVDGNRCPNISMSCDAIVKGDLTVPVISAASILAKVTRDRQMLEIEEKYPGYGFASHKGYPTKKHIEALNQLGVLPIHRRTFSPVSKLLTHI
jgi:ribonuclease HII